MLGPEYKWLLAPVRSVAARVALARRGLLTLFVAACCLLGVLLPARPALTPVVAPAVASLEEAAPEWPRTLVHIWFLLPQLLPGSH